VAKCVSPEKKTPKLVCKGSKPYIAVYEKRHLRQLLGSCQPNARSVPVIGIDENDDI
jgi:hypothetical protein